MPIKKYCQKCSHELESWSIGWYCANCGCFEDMSGNVHEKRNEPFMPPKTNAEKIRSMTDEELANYFCEIIDCEVCKSFIIKNEACNCENGFPQGILEWLKHPAEGE